jgi:beta-lactamase superfamily II metal-dependent hydrolase
MNYYYHKRRYPDDVLVSIEEYNKDTGTVLFDFLDSNEYNSFTEIGGLNYSLSNPSMVLLTNYKQRKIQENTIYAIKKNVIENWRELNLTNFDNQNSFLIGYTIELTSENNQIFFESVSLNDFLDFSLNYYYIRGSENLMSLPIDVKGKLSVTIRNVGQGSWNEINENDKTSIVFDAGASIYATKTDIRNIIGNRSDKYSTEKPGLILSHWDKDHYHSLVGMTDAELANFAFFICRDRIPNLTSRVLLGRIISAIGMDNTYKIPSEPRTARGGHTHLIPLMPLSSQLMIYNAQHHKNRNISGIVISLKTKASSIILAGDCHYEQISVDVLPHLNFKHKHYLIVPHHGGKAGNYIYNLPRKATPVNAIISVGPNNYGHPMLNYTRAIANEGFSVLKTNIKNNDITINL